MALYRYNYFRITTFGYGPVLYFPLWLLQMKKQTTQNIDKSTVESFGDEWLRFDQKTLSDSEAHKIFDKYFAVFPWNELPSNASGFDMGCGTGRWAKFVLPKVGQLFCIDPSAAIHVAKENLIDFKNVKFIDGSVDDPKLENESQDFGYSLGVLHHVPDTEKAIKSCVCLLKPGAPFLLYLYYALDNRPKWFKSIWVLSNILRHLIIKLPFRLRLIVTNMIALFVYLPFAKLAQLLNFLNINSANLPLNEYRDTSFYTMRTDSRDRFGTPLEKRFTRDEIEKMMKSAGLKDIIFSEQTPYWCALGRRAH